MDKEFNAIFGENQPIEEVTQEATTEIKEEVVAETVETEVKEEPAPEVRTQDEETKESHMVPLAALQAERDAKKALKKELDDLRQARAAQESPAPDPKKPDPYDDPEGSYAYIEAQIQQARLANKFEVSEMLAVRELGEAKVRAAQSWAMDAKREDPTWVNTMYSQQHPIEWIVREHERHAQFEEMRRDPDAWALRRAAELSANIGSVPAAHAPVSENNKPDVEKVRAPKSLANATSATKSTRQTTSAQAFDDIFNMKR